jgi:MFS family permease
VPSINEAFYMDDVEVTAPMLQTHRAGLLRLCIFILTIMFGIGLASPILPLYASSLGASWLEIGLLGTSWGITTTILATTTWRISDKFGRKPLLIASAGLSSAVAFFYRASSTVPQIILLRIVEGVAWALFWPSIEALVTEVVEPNLTGRAMGFATVSYAIAFGTSSLSAGAIAEILGYRSTFIFYLAFALLSIPIVVSLRDSDRIARRSTEESRRLNLDELKSKEVVMACVLGVTYTLGLGTLLTFFPVFAKTLGATVFMIGILSAFFWIGRILGSYHGGHLSDEHGRGIVATGALLLSTTGFIIIAISNGTWGLLAGVILTGAGIGAALPISVALISDHIRESLRGFVMGIFETACGAGVILSAAVGGLLADMYSPNSPYIMAASVNLACAALFVARRVR